MDWNAPLMEGGEWSQGPVWSPGRLWEDGDWETWQPGRPWEETDGRPGNRRPKHKRTTSHRKMPGARSNINFYCLKVQLYTTSFHISIHSLRGVIFLFWHIFIFKSTSSHLLVALFDFLFVALPFFFFFFSDCTMIRSLPSILSDPASIL